MDVLALSSTDMPGVDPSIIYHWLFIDLEIKVVKQKLKKINAKRCRHSTRNSTDCSEPTSLGRLITQSG